MFTCLSVGDLVTFNINIITPQSAEKRVPFAFDLSANSESALHDHIGQFCDVELNNFSQECITLVRHRFMEEHAILEDFEKNIPSFLQPQMVTTSFSQNLLSLACPQPIDNEMNLTCVVEALQAIRSVKVVTLANYMNSLMDIMHNNTLVNLTKGWEDNIEGSIIMFIEKVFQLQALADDIRVETICEVGFNLGHSSMNWMIANPLANILSFDLSQYDYTAAAINAFGELFPNRIINLVEGDSKRTVPNFSHMFGIHKSRDEGFKCNLIFIDGSHYHSNAYADIVNFAPFANSSYHRLIVDDMQFGGVRQAVARSVTEGLVTPGEEIHTPHSECYIADLVRHGPYRGSYVFREKTQEENCTITKIKDDVIYIGEYIV